MRNIAPSRPRALRHTRSRYCSLYSAFVGLFVLFSLFSCAEKDNEINAEADIVKEYGYPLDDMLRVNHLQAKGTHNSYHIENDDPADDSHRYTMPSLTDQLDLYGIRQLELDVHYSEADGYTVFHIPVIDAQSTCPKFVDCLQEIKTWSDRNQGHHVLFVWIEIKDLLDPESLEDFDDFDQTIRAVWPEDRLLTPDDVQGDYASLSEALQKDGWPTLGETRDHIMFLLNNGEDKADDYSDGYTSLKDRVMFVRAASDSPLYAIKKHGSHEEQRQALQANILVGDNAGGAGSDDLEAQSAVDAGWKTGVHFLASDFPAQIAQQEFYLQLPEGSPSRCNPQTAPANCTSAAIESLPRSRQ